MERVFQQVRGILYSEIRCPTYVVSRQADSHMLARNTRIHAALHSSCAVCRCEESLHAAACVVHLLVLTLAHILGPGRQGS